jgi:hypothetical protein
MKNAGDPARQESLLFYYQKKISNIFLSRHDRVAVPFGHMKRLLRHSLTDALARTMLFGERNRLWVRQNLAAALSTFLCTLDARKAQKQCSSPPAEKARVVRRTGHCLAHLVGSGRSQRWMLRCGVYIQNGQEKVCGRATCLCLDLPWIWAGHSNTLPKLARTMGEGSTDQASIRET